MFCSKVLLTPYRIMYYAVRRGKKPGIYPNWKECEAQVKGFKGPVFRKFSSHSEAEEFMNSKGSGKSFKQECSGSSSSNGKEDNNESFDMEHCDFGFDSTSNSLDTGFILKSLSEMKTSILQLHQHTGLITQTLSGLSNTLSTIENSVFASSLSSNKKNTPSKRAHSPEEEQSPKKHKSSSDDINGNFSGIPFAESEGTVVYTDGACFNNGQIGATAGVGVYWGPNHKDNVSRSLDGRQTNNRAEIHAAIIAIEQAKLKNIDKLVLYTDSEFLINSITKWIAGWKRRDWKLSTGKPVINKEDFQELDKALEGINVKWVYVRGHCGNPGNEAADRLANEGARSNNGK